MATVGERLRQERETRGKTIAEIAEATGVGSLYLEAMESGTLDALPGRAFGKLYIRAYAEVLGFDPRPLIDAYDREPRAADGGAREPSPPGVAGPRPVAAAIEPWKAVRDASTERDDGAPEPPGEPAALVHDAVAAKPPSHGKPSRRAVATLIVSAALVVLIGSYAGLRRTAPGPPAPPPRREVVASARAPAPSPAPPAKAEPSPAPRRLPPATSPSVGLSVSEFGVGRRVVASRLEGEAERFSEGEAVTFQTRVVGGGSGDLVRHVWIFEGRVQQSIPLRIGGPDWRTHSTKTLYRTGSWTVEARDTTGRVLARAAFRCDPRPR